MTTLHKIVDGELVELTEDELVALEAERSAPLPPPIIQSVSRRQILTGLAIVGWITQQEAEAALATGARPVAVEAVIEVLPEEQRFEARMKWIGFQHAHRDDPMVSALAAAEGKTAQDVDEFFILCAGID